MIETNLIFPYHIIKLGYASSLIVIRDDVTINDP